MIREVTINDLDTINSFLDELIVKHITGDELLNHPFSKYVVISNESEIVGFMNYSIIYEKMELNFIFIKLAHRKMGYASLMLEYLINLAYKLKSSNITLEVAIGNINAINLYLKYGFIYVATRKNYYGHEDALLMIRKMVANES
jgi:ribosomal-protein-alanine N-acetyltransferase